jgi:CRP-like cAMP-binding protein
MTAFSKLADAGATTAQPGLAGRGNPNAISVLPLFAGVDPAIVGELQQKLVLKRHQAGEILLRQSGSARNIKIIRRGIFELVRQEGEQDCGVLLLSPGDLILPAAALWQEPTLVTVRALTAGSTWQIPAPDLRDALDRSTRLSRNLMMVFAGQWRMAVRTLLDLNCRSAPQRLASLLLRLVDSQPNELCPVLPFSKRQLAVRVNVSPETLSRALQTVAREGLHVRGRAIIVRDRARIEAFCGPDPYAHPDEHQMNVFAI